MPFDHASAVEWIERSTRDHPFCQICSAPTDITDEDGLLVLRCTAAISPRGVVGRLSAALLPHDRLLVLDMRDDVAA